MTGRGGEPRTLLLRFDDECSAVVRARIGYAAQVFSAIYGYRFSDAEHPPPGGGTATVTVLYGPRREGGPGERRLPCRYQERPAEEPVPAPVLAPFAGGSLPVFHGVDPASGLPDLLGEIFEWLSAADEWSVRVRDGVGRVPIEATVFGRFDLDPTRAYAARLMAWFDAWVVGSDDTFRPAPSPESGTDHFVVVTHDVDFYSTGRPSVVKRAAKNVAVAALARRDPGMVGESLGTLAAVLGGRRMGNYIPPLLEASERDRFRSTYFVMASCAHRRDANYEISQIAGLLGDVLDAGGGVGLHGSYDSIVEHRDLGREAKKLADAIGGRPTGSRQHWLRFDAYPSLYGSVEAQGFLFDSTLGFPRSVGFRNGAPFAFPPYHFTEERPCRFLEIPLVVMDAALPRRPADEAGRKARRVLDESRRWGWGGVALLWHDPVEQLSEPSVVNDVFWELLSERGSGEAWTSGDDFVARCLGRYRDAGLAIGVRDSDHVDPDPVATDELDE